MPAPTVHQSNVGAQRTGPEGTLHLTVMAPNVFETFPLPTSGSIKIGRDELADVRITDDLASRMHARLDVEPPAHLMVEDLGSSNGTFVRGEKIEPGRRVALQLGEALTIGFTHLMVQRRRPAAPARRFHGHGAFEERLEDACARAAETAAAVAVVRVQIEDEEPAGRGADTVAGALRPGDFLAQYAPGDYEALLLDTDADRARAIADDAARRLRAEGLGARTVVATCPADGRSAEALIGRTSALLRDSADERPSEPVLKSEAMRALYRLAERAAAGRTATGLINILVLGETGAGKEVLSDWIHRRSPRAGGPFVCINCGALTDTLLESELFGHEKGAFTGAAQAKPGLLEAAAGGTVFLDEIGDMPSSLQTKLLRAIESRQITRVGGLSQRPIDVRFIAATNLDLEAEIARKAFRQDLYFRLNGISLTIPPRWRAASWPRHLPPRSAARRVSPTMPSTSCAGTAGPGTSASFATSWNGRWCCARGARLASSTSRWKRCAWCGRPRRQRRQPPRCPSPRPGERSRRAPTVSASGSSPCWRRRAATRRARPRFSASPAAR
jgi:two-component system response regulator AtoC